MKASKISAENEELRRKYQKVKHQRDELSQELNSLLEKAKLESLLKGYVTTRNVYVQTDPQKAWFAGLSVKKKDDCGAASTTDTDKTSKLLNMHTQLMRRYEREIKQNMSHVDTVSTLNIKISELEKQIREEKDKVHKLEVELMTLKSHARIKSGQLSTTDGFDQKVLKERDKLKKEVKKLKSEIKGLDPAFFDEIEDLKYALQQSAKLNKEYEQALRKLCKQFGVPYPRPETVLDS